MDGKNVLHLDKNDFYGGSASSANLEQTTKRWQSDSAISADTDVSVPSIGEISVKLSSMGVHVAADDLSVQPVRARTSSRVVASSPREKGAPPPVGTSRSARSFHPAVFDYTMERNCDNNECSRESAETVHPVFIGYRKDTSMTLERAFHHSRRFSIDENPRLLLSYGKMVDAMLASGVNSYMEFVSIEAIYIVRPRKVPTSTEAPGEVEIENVPCSKADVFKSKLLSGLEKRLLMKLLQLAVDYGNSLRGVEESYQNESTLVQGRALHRPQNTHVESNGKLSEEALKNKPFSDFLVELSIPSHLRDIILYAMCLSKTVDCPASEGLEFLYRHVYASGRLGETAFLYPIYGITEIPESFCRSAAVRGAVYALRQTVIGVVSSKAKTEAASAHLQDSDLFHNGDGTPEYAGKASGIDPAAGITFVDTADHVVAVLLQGGTVMACDNIVMSPSEYTNCLPERADVGSSGYDNVSKHQLTRISICTGDQYLSASRGLAVLPPGTGTLGNKYPVFVLQLDASAMVCPHGCYLLYTMTLTDGPGVESGDAAYACLSQRIFDYVKSISLCGHNINEIYFCTKVSEYTSNDGMLIAHSTASSAVEEPIGPPNCGLCVNHREGNSMVVDTSVSQAEKICTQLYPDMGFFAEASETHTTTSGKDDDAELLLNM